MTRQWLRNASLVVSPNTGDGIELSTLRFTFDIRQADIQTPNAATFRIYNLSDATANKIAKEFTRIDFSAGYGDELNLVFTGTIKQTRRGREDSVTSYLDIFAADGDVPINYGVVNQSVVAGSTRKQRIEFLASAMKVSVDYLPPDLPELVLPRGVVLHGMARDLLRQELSPIGYSWSIQRGRLVVLPKDGVRPGEAVVLSAATGMLGWPEQTELGIKVNCLLNPRLTIGSSLQIDNKSILTAAPSQSLQGQLAFQNLQASVPLNDDGLYRVYVLNHFGDSRGSSWTTEIICLSLNGPVSQGLARTGQG